MSSWLPDLEHLLLLGLMIATINLTIKTMSIVTTPYLHHYQLISHRNCLPVLEIILKTLNSTTVTVTGTSQEILINPHMHIFLQFQSHKLTLLLHSYYMISMYFTMNS